jgi:xanthine dehydrogenase YagR molybdenum-binding subunit
MMSRPTEDAMRVPGVVRVLTPDDFPPPPAAPAEPGHPPPPRTLETQIAYRGHPVALVLAETLEAAIEGAEAIRPTYAEELFPALLDSASATREPTKDVVAGDEVSAFAVAATVINATYESPTQHHNAIELLATTAVWADGRLALYACSQGVSVARGAVAGALRVIPRSSIPKVPTSAAASARRGRRNGGPRSSHARQSSPAARLSWWRRAARSSTWPPTVRTADIRSSWAPTLMAR